MRVTIVESRKGKKFTEKMKLKDWPEFLSMLSKYQEAGYTTRYGKYFIAKLKIEDPFTFREVS